jgi:hypothetical protein
MQFGAGEAGSVGFGSILQDGGLTTTKEDLGPIMTELNGVDLRGAVLMDSLGITDTLGQPVEASLAVRGAVPVVGDQIEIRYFSVLLFAGSIDHIDQRNEGLAGAVYVCGCLDASQSLLRRRVRRNFTNATVQAIVQSLLDNELVGEGLTQGVLDARSIVPLLDSDGGKIFDALRTLATATGQTFYMDFDRSIQMRSINVPVAPIVLNEANTLVDGTTIQTDRETYRNRQIVVVTGTPPEGADALVITVSRQNDGQIAARAAIEGGTGIYEEIEEITHPTSNDGIQITLLAIGYANLRLSTSGQTRQTVTVNARGYGFRAGQIATVDLPTFGIAGTFIIQRVTIKEMAGRYLFHALELVNSSAQQRAYESWLSIVKGGRVTVQIPSAVTNNLQTFDVPGADVFIVPAGVTVLELTVYGSSAGGGGGARETGINGLCEVCTSGGYYADGASDGANGGAGGASGKAVTVINVTPGDSVLTQVGSAGTRGANDTDAFNTLLPVGSTQTTTAADGVDGAASWATYKGSVVCQGDGGKKGKKGVCVESRLDSFHYRLCKTVGAAGLVGSGSGDAVSAGGGFAGGAKGVGNASGVSSGGAGHDGRIEVRW